MIDTARRLSALALILLLAFGLPVAAQKRRTSRPPHVPKDGAAKKDEGAKQETFTIPNLVTGQRIIEGTMDNNTINVPLAPGSVVMVEFPARDSILRVHPGDEKLVTVDDTDTKPNFPLIFRPGTGFAVGKGAPQLLTNLTVQMASGVPFVFLIYPVASAKQSATHIYIRYDRDKIVADRRAAGLPVNYKPVPLRPGVYAPEDAIAQAAPTPAPTPVAQSETASLSFPAPTPEPRPEPTPVATQAAVSNSPARPTATPAVLTTAAPSFVGSITNSPAPPRAETPRNIPVSTPAAETTRPTVAADPAVGAPRHVERAGRVVSPPPVAHAAQPRVAPASLLSDSLRAYMREVVADARAFSKYSKSLYGLSVAVSRPKDLNLETRFIVVAVKNTLGESVRLVPGQPDLFVETLDDKKSPVVVEPLQKLGLETTAPNGDLLAPGATAYYAVAFTPPILGTHQYLRISVAQTTAADAPSSVDLTIKSR